MNEKADSSVWFVTGTSSGFGRALVEELIARGERVVATARDPEKVADLVARAPDRVAAVRLDVTDGGQIPLAIEAAVARFGRIDVLVNNAGYSVLGALEETSEAELRAAMETLFFGAVATTKAVIPSMRAQRRGTIVQISSVAGLTTAPGFGLYSATKHALEAVSEALAMELAPYGVRVLIVEPGAFRTALFGGGFRALPELPFYADTVGAMRAYARDSAGKQAGDPRKAVRAIIDQVHAGAPNLRLPLGADSVSALRQKLAQVAADLDATEAIAVATAFDSTGEAARIDA